MATLTLDVAPTAAQRGGAAHNPVYAAFNCPAPAKQHNIGRVARQASAVAGAHARWKHGE
jgi:hypothetical protein